MTIYHDNRKALNESQIPNLDTCPIFNDHDIFILEILGKGGFGIVKKAYHKILQKYVALKYLNLEDNKEENKESVLEQTVLENELLFKIERIRNDQPDLPFLSYDGIFKDSIDKTPILQMENGIANLNEILVEGKKYSCGEVLFVLKKLAYGFSKLQEMGIANRDVKPANIILSEDDKDEDHYDYKISDFGIGCIITSPDLMISCREITGYTTKYVAPEVKDLFLKSKNDNNFDEKYNPFLSDVYSLGLTVLKMIDFSFNKEIFLKKKEELKSFEPIFDVLEKMLENDPKKRIDFTTLHVVVSELEERLNFGIKPKDEIIYYKQMIDTKEQSKTKISEIYELYKEHKQLYEKYIDNVSRLKEANYHMDLASKHLKRLEEKANYDEKNMMNLLEERIEILNNYGVLYQKSGKLEISEQSLLESLELCKNLTCENESHRCYGLVYFSFGSLFDKWGISEKAEQFYNKSLDIRCALNGEEDADTAASYNNLGELYHNRGDFPKAEHFYQKSLKIRQQIQGKNHIDTAESMNNLGLLYDSMGLFDKAEPLLIKALEIRRALYGENHALTAFSYNNLGFMFQDKGDLENSEKYYLKSLNIRKNLYGDYNSNTAQSYNNLGSLYANLGDTEKAESNYLKCIQINEKLFTENHSDTAGAYSNLGLFYFNIGKMNKVEDLYRKALNARLKIMGEFHVDTAVSYGNIGLFHETFEEFDLAEEVYLKELNIRLKINENGDINIGNCYHKIGSLYLKMGNLEKSQSNYLKSLEIRKKMLGENHPAIADSLFSLGELHFKIGALTKAREFYEESLKIKQKVFDGANHPQVADLFNKLGTLLMKNGEFQKAEEFLNKSIEMFIEIFGEIHGAVAFSYENLGELANAMGDLEKAKGLFEKSTEIKEQLK